MFDGGDIADSSLLNDWRDLGVPHCDAGPRKLTICVAKSGTTLLLLRGWSIARGFVDKCIEGVDSPALEQRDIHPGDDRGGSLGSELPEQSAVVVIHLRGTHHTECESWSALKNLIHPRVDGIATDDLFVSLKENAVFRVDFADDALAEFWIPLAEHFQKISFHQMTHWIAHHP
ncbi:MAG TPA: hypothetical protein VNG73_01345, partial [Gemmatimonadaceae bacterium]|nr:hypothetical protein [Gemmatimonadaceae bacterium]